jgi:hypothetical protein
MTYQLTASDWAEVERITDEIIVPAYRGMSREEFRTHVKATLAANMVIAQDEYDAALEAESTHKWEFGSHSISECRIDWCGRYKGQRR